MRLTKRMVQKAVDGDDHWAVGNQVLYDLCRRCPEHSDRAQIVAKVWLVGRAYAASVERGRGGVPGMPASSDRFYTHAVAPTLCRSHLDRTLRVIPRRGTMNESSIRLALEAHAYLVDVFHRLTGKNKRSLASKYLHFHMPNRFFIFDSRADKSIRALHLPVRSLEVPRKADSQYAKFVAKALGATEWIRDEFGVALTPRQLDRLLLAVFEHRYR